MNQVPDETVDLVVTSPPYPMIQMWDDIFSSREPEIEQALKKGEATRAFDLMHGLLEPVWREVHRVLKRGGFACINIGNATRTLNGDFGLYPNQARVTEIMMRLGFTVLPEIIWRKQTNAPNKFMGSGMLPAGAYVTLEHEHILVFRKGGKRLFNTEAEKQIRRDSAFFWEERNRWFSDVWMELKGTTQALENTNTRSRSAAFPFSLPYRLINMYSVKGDMVLDPFTGTGTTMFAAMTAARHFTGFEIDREFLNMIHAFIPSVQAMANQKITSRLENHVRFIQDQASRDRVFKHLNRHYDFPVVTRQEKDLLINPLESVTMEGDNRYRTVYSQMPQKGFSGYRTLLDGRDKIRPHTSKTANDPMQKDAQLKLF